jgi:hypothetical protein
MRRAVVFSALGLLLLLGLFKFPVPIYRDHTFLHFPVWEVAAQSEGFFFPLSNPYLNHGAPMASDPNHLLLYPTAWLLKFLTAQQAYSIHFFGHALLSFWLMAFLLMGRLDRTKALILAAFWVLSGPFLSASSSLNLFTAFCWVPGIMLAAQRASIPGQVLTLSMTALAGEPVIGLAAAALALVYSPNRKRTLVALGLTALLFLPFFMFLHEAFAYSTRMMGGQTWRTALNASLNPARLPEALLPFLFGVPGTRAGWASFLNPKDFLLPTLGMLWLAFALFEGKRKDWIILIGLLFLGLGSFNPLVAAAYKAIPQLAWLRFPEKFFLLAAFLLCWRAVDRPLKYRWLPWTGLTTIFVLPLSPAAGALLLASWGTLWLWSTSRPRWALAPGLAFGLMLAFFSVPLSSDLYSLQKPEQMLLEHLQGKRVLDQRDPYKIPEEMRERYRSERKLLGLPIEPPLKEPYFLRRRLFLAPTGMAYGIKYAFVENTSGSGLIYYDMVRDIVPSQMARISWIYDFRQLSDPPVPPEKDYRLFKKAKCFSSVVDLIAQIQAPDFDPAKEVILSGACEPLNGNTDFHWHIRTNEFPDQPILREYNFGGSEPDLPSWGVWDLAWNPLIKVALDGNNTRPSLAFGALLAVYLPPGGHSVELSEPYPHSLLILLALFYAMLLSVALHYLIRERFIYGGTP